MLMGSAPLQSEDRRLHSMLRYQHGCGVDCGCHVLIDQLEKLELATVVGLLTMADQTSNHLMSSRCSCLTYSARANHSHADHGRAEKVLRSTELGAAHMFCDVISYAR